MPDSLTKIHPFPELRALAERTAQEHADARAAYGYTHDTGGASWAAMAPTSRDIAVRVELALLCDLTRTASRDAVARLVAERAGGVSRPDFFLGESSRMWWSGGGPCFVPWDVDDTDGALSGGIHIPTLAGVTDPAEALALIVRHLWPEAP